MSGKFTVEILNAKSLKPVVTLNLNSDANVLDAKKAIYAQKKYLYTDRQMLRSEQTGRPLKDEDRLESFKTKESDSLKLYFKDLGPQVGWTTVFLTEYAGPLFIYLLFYIRPTFIYGQTNARYHQVVNIACACWVFHYAKRLLETIFVHKFSHATMPITNIFKNSAYYWGFAAFVAYYMNHPLYSTAYFGDLQIYLGLAGFAINELGNYSIHLSLSALRPAGSKIRKIPFPTSNPFTLLFNFVSCPNYTYEIGSWISFVIMTQSVPALLFALAGTYQMTVWAIGKHRNYRKEFEKYPRGRKAIFPFII
jgi:very-long-chain enoyl-CoA reductase